MGAALVLHAIVLVVMPRARPRPIEAKAPEATVEIETLPSRTGGAIGHGGGSAVAREIGHGHGDGHGHGHALGHAAEPTTNEEPSQTPDQGETEPLPSITGPQSIGLDGPGSFRMEIAREQPDPKDEVAENVKRSIMDPIRAHEAQNGDLTSGPIVAELEHTTRSMPSTPFEGRAVFSIDVDELGLVVHVGVSESSGERLAWEDVAKGVMNAFAQKRLKVPPGAKHVAMRIEVFSKVTLPSGARHAMNVDSPAAQGLARAAHGQFDRPAESPGIIGGSFDLSDIGAHPMRVVGARVITQQAF